MSRCAVFVDAGYLWAGGTDAVFGSQNSHKREDITFLHKEFISYLKERASIITNNKELLRVYWYDGAPDRQPTKEHLKIASIPETKIRIGHFTANGVQKNVDAMLLLDLTNLARVGAIDTAVILAGDGDFLEGVSVSQELGVKVYLLGISGEVESISPELRNEVDICRYLEPKDLTRFFSLTNSSTTTKSRWVTLEMKNPKEVTGEITKDSYRDGSIEITMEDMCSAGKSFATRQKLRLSPTEVEAVCNSFPQVPDQLHYLLLRYTFERHGIVWGSQLPYDYVQEIRNGFWDEIKNQG